MIENKLEAIKSSLLKVYPDYICHGFFTRSGGFSEGIYAGLNVGLESKDIPENIWKNRIMVSHFLQVDYELLLTPYQFHSSTVILVDNQISAQEFYSGRPKADAIVTTLPECAVGVTTADCAPVLFADVGAGIIGAAHAGWKGVCKGILENTITTMEKLGAVKNNMRAAIGPAISQKKYEVGREFFEYFLKLDSNNKQFFLAAKKNGYAMFDLTGYILYKLHRYGINADSVNLCTYSDEKRFFSYRRACHETKTDYGRQLSAIRLKY